MDRASLILAALAALVASTAPTGPPPRPHDLLGQQGRRGAAAGIPAPPAEPAAEYGAEYEDGGDDDEEEGDVYEDEYGSSGEHGVVEQPGDKPTGLRRGRHAAHHLNPDVANKAMSAGPRIVFEEAPPSGTCPPAAVAPASRADPRCRAARCSHDSDCASPRRPGERDVRRCCSNGCVRTCQLIASPPLMVDWEGETPDVLHPELPVTQSGGDWPLPWTRPQPAVQYHNAAPEVVVLPGGCSLPPAQYRRIMAFIRGAAVKKCACNAGTVVCHVN